MKKKRKTLPRMIPREAFGLNNTALYILADLFKAKRFLSTKQIAERNNISWMTARNNVEKLKRRGLVNCTKSVRRNYCKIKKSFFDSIKLCLLLV